jgi:hypothetical protein
MILKEENLGTEERLEMRASETRTINKNYRSKTGFLHCVPWALAWSFMSCSFTQFPVLDWGFTQDIGGVWCHIQEFVLKEKTGDVL